MEIAVLHKKEKEAVLHLMVARWLGMVKSHWVAEGKEEALLPP